MADAADVVRESDEANNNSALSVRVVPIWVPRLVQTELLDQTTVRLLFRAEGFEMSELKVQGTGEVPKAGGWSNEEGATLRRTETGLFEALVPVQGNARFYRIQASLPGP